MPTTSVSRGVRNRPSVKWFLAIVGLLPATASVTTAQTSDTTPPQLVAFDFTPQIDLSMGPQSVTVTIEVTDDLSGVSFVDVVFLSPSGAQEKRATTFTPISGDQLHGTFEATLGFSEFQEGGLWTAVSLVVGDFTGNVAFLDASTLEALGFPIRLNVLNATPDTQPPTVTDIQI
jgi:hypothetical protein